METGTKDISLAEVVARLGAERGVRVGITSGKTTTFTAGLRRSGMGAPMVLDGAMNGPAFLAYIEQVLVPTLAPGDIVVMGNLRRAILVEAPVSSMKISWATGEAMPRRQGKPRGSRLHAHAD